MVGNEALPLPPPVDEEAPPTPPTEGERQSEAPRRRRLKSLAFLVVGAVVAVSLAKMGPQEQHVRVVLGPAAPEVTEVGLQYVAKDGEIAREAHFSYPSGAAPRIVAHEAKLANGDYRVQIDVDARDGRREIQRQVTLSGGSTQIDVSSALSRSRAQANERLPP